MSTTTKPKLSQLKTPVTATFPSELSALSAKTPRSAVPDFIKEEFPGSQKTPISPPLAYMDFLRNMASPVAQDKTPDSASPDDDGALESAPSTASSEQTDCSCKCGGHKSPTTAPTSYPTQPMSAPPSGAYSFTGLHVPVSPSASHLDSPLSATARSPFSARSVRSPFDWETALKGRYSADCRANKPSSSKSVRQIREVVTRTVTYTPRMEPAPRGKRKRTHSNCSKAPQGPAAGTRANSA